jgi:hypothetical protein
MSGPTDTSLILTAGSEPPDRHAGPDRPLVGDPLDQRNNIWAPSSLISQPAQRETHTQVHLPSCVPYQHYHHNSPNAEAEKGHFT